MVYRTGTGILLANEDLKRLKVEPFCYQNIQYTRYGIYDMPVSVCVRTTSSANRLVPFVRAT
jgi:hypothetical protein